MPVNKFITGCCCDLSSCIPFQDNFNRDDDADIGEFWKQPLGTFSIDTNKLKCVSNNALAFQWTSTSFGDLLGDADPEMMISVDVKGSDGDIVRIYNWIEGSTSVDLTTVDRMYAELKIGTNATLKLFKYDGSLVEHGTANVTAAAAGTHKIGLLTDFNNNSVWLNDEKIFGLRTGVIGGFKTNGAVGTGSISTATGVTFDDFEMAYHNGAAALHQPCTSGSYCYWPNGPAACLVEKRGVGNVMDIEVTISGITNGTTANCGFGSANADNCTAWDGTYVLSPDYFGNLSTSGTPPTSTSVMVTNCDWYHLLSPPIKSFNGSSTSFQCFGVVLHSFSLIVDSGQSSGATPAFLDFDLNIFDSTGILNARYTHDLFLDGSSTSTDPTSKTVTLNFSSSGVCNCCVMPATVTIEAVTQP